ncbi:hypothetical protein [Sphingobacterium pedocola]|uniref:Uncharacterized protein n=1 Tax=Sphingobacterium pedocola TaxID=2082722 RepID=A0ABR9TCB6_9SPHI|nr:hypothetical protein [Sphingobacterium pedocola]MBE8722981.1 hypothetical protein [Sphingobacterium pedocola]
MKQFYELYTPKSAIFKLWKETASPVATQMKNEQLAIVSPLATQLQVTDCQYTRFISLVLLQILWANHGYRMQYINHGQGFSLERTYPNFADTGSYQ